MKRIIKHFLDTVSEVLEILEIPEIQKIVSKSKYAFIYLKLEKTKEVLQGYFDRYFDLSSGSIIELIEKRVIASRKRSLEEIVERTPEEVAAEKAYNDANKVINFDGEY